MKDKGAGVMGVCVGGWVGGWVGGMSFKCVCGGGEGG